MNVFRSKWSKWFIGSFNLFFMDLLFIVQSIIEIGILKFPTIIAELLFLILLLSVLFHIFWAFFVRCFLGLQSLSFWWIDPYPLPIINCLSFSVVTIIFFLMIILLNIIIVIPVLFWLSFTWYIFFHPFTFKLYVSLNQNCISDK